MRWLGLDLGRRRIGVAASDPLGKLAFALGVVTSRSWKEDLESIAKIAREEKAEGIVVGLPRQMNGSEGTEAQRARKYAQELENVTGLPVVLWDERLSTVAAERGKKEAGKRGAGNIDAHAAAIILQNYLDSRES
ncbi:MAG: Holliday junction resolvase RuvX [Chloroflexi bacterium]|nr:Holliday junction resolvase RuvX [Chloroflexota bacterium]